MNEIEIRPARLDDPDVHKLVADALADLAARYGGNGDDTPVAASDFAPPGGEFLVAVAGGELPSGGEPAFRGELVGSAAWRSHGEDAELKRLYTAPHVRGRGVARRLLTAIEDSARSRGRRRMILETGDRQPEAVALYLSHGYERIANFGYYRDEPGVLSYGRTL